MNNNFKFLGKILIDADLECVTALHIGGTQEGYEIGGMDNPVIKTPLEIEFNGLKIPANCPYIPGSSLKGKMRSLLEWALPNKVKPKPVEENGRITGYRAEMHQCKDEKEDEFENCGICVPFGISADKQTKIGPTRLTVLDSFPNPKTIELWDRDMGEGIFTEVKSENNIDRLSSNANPRSMERVPAGSVFRAKMIYTLYKETDLEMLKNVLLAMEILEDSTLGGGGSRGSGRIRFKGFDIKFRPKSYYIENKDEKVVNLDGADSPRAILEKFSTLFNSELIKE
jgi:CRISPR-associated protein Csm3